jgi:hypothetical protein
MEVESDAANYAPESAWTERDHATEDHGETTASLQGDEGQPRKKPRLVGNDVDEILDPQTSESKKKRKTKQQMEADENMDWVCALCKEAECMMQPNADEFLICDGGCERVFHYPCAGLAQIPDKNQDWVCQDCNQGRHPCAFCHEFGQDRVDMFKCRKAKCGLFFHESCLAMNNVPVKMQQVITHEQNPGKNSPKNVEANLLGNDFIADSVPVFTCPAHQCWTCTQDDELQKEREDAEAKRNEVRKKTKKRAKKMKSIYICKTEGRIFVCFVSVA